MGASTEQPCGVVGTSCQCAWTRSVFPLRFLSGCIAGCPSRGRSDLFESILRNADTATRSTTNRAASTLNTKPYARREHQTQILGMSAFRRVSMCKCCSGLPWGSLFGSVVQRKGFV